MQRGKERKKDDKNLGNTMTREKMTERRGDAVMLWYRKKREGTAVASAGKTYSGLHHYGRARYKCSPGPHK